MSATLALGATAALALAGAARRRGARNVRGATLENLRELDAILAYDSPYADGYRGYVYHGTTQRRWATGRASDDNPRSTLHLSASAEESREYALLASGSDAGDPPLVLRVPLRALVGYVLGPDHGFEDDVERGDVVLGQDEDVDWKTSARECGFFTIWGAIDPLKPRFTPFRRRGGPGRWQLVEPPGKVSPP